MRNTPSYSIARIFAGRGLRPRPRRFTRVSLAFLRETSCPSWFMPLFVSRDTDGLESHRACGMGGPYVASRAAVDCGDRGGPAGSAALVALRDSGRGQ